MDKKTKDIDVQLDEKIAEGIYSNLVIVNHSHSEFVLDFVSMLPGIPKAKVKSRIILSPQHTKGLFRALKENISKYEQSNGKIVDTGGEVVVPLNFGPTGEA